MDCINARSNIPQRIGRGLSGRLHYSDVIRPSEWKFTKRDLNALLERIAAHEDAALTPAA